MDQLERDLLVSAVLDIESETMETALAERNPRLEIAPTVAKNSPLGFRAVFAGMHPPIDEVKPNNASGIGDELRREGIRSRCTGKERDGESGLDFFGARYFSGAQGRFTSPDAPFADQDPRDPQSWNLYAYVGNNPLAFVDSDGRGKLKATAAVLQRLQVGFRQIVVRHEKNKIGAKAAKDRLLQEGGDVKFEGEASAYRAAGGSRAVRHNAHVKTAGEEALDHYHPVDSAGSKAAGHAFVRNSSKIAIPGAVIGTIPGSLPTAEHMRTASK